MKQTSSYIAFLLWMGLLAASGYLYSPVFAQTAVIGETVYPVIGDPIEQGVVLVRDGRIENVGPLSEIEIPDEYERYQGAVVTPGLIDAHSVVGLAGYYNQEHDQDQLDYSESIQPELRAIDAYNAREELVGFLRNNGITTIHTGHAPGAIISGQTMIVKTTGRTVEEAIVDSTTALAVTLGSVVRRHYDSPGTRAKGIAMLRQELIRAQNYMEKRSHDDPDRRPDRDLRMEALADLLDGSIVALVTAHRSHDIMAAFRLQREFGFRMLLDGAAESPLLLDEISEAGVPVIIHPTMIRTRGDTEHAAFDTPKKLAEAGIVFAFQSGYESYVPKSRVALFEAAIAVGYGLDRHMALRALTIEPAKILNIDDRVGSLEAGKDADLVIFDGDPFEYINKPTHVMINGTTQAASYPPSENE